jgi:hypothetical protein
MTRRQIGLSLAFGALFTAVGLLGLLRHLTPEWLVSFFAVLGIIFIVMGASGFYARDVPRLLNWLWFLNGLLLLFYALSDILTIYFPS